MTNKEIKKAVVWAYDELLHDERTKTDPEFRNKLGELMSVAGFFFDKKD